MWTPRRIMLVVAGMLIFGGAFGVYATFLGWIDGLPALPQVYTHPMVDGKHIPDVNRTDGPIDTRLKLAFGPGCVEVHYKLKFEAQKKGLLFAATDYKQLEDGRVQLDQVSVAIFGKGTREISTVHADRAFLTCDKPIRRIEDMSSRKVIAAELVADADYQVHDARKGFVYITNNRKTFDAADDILVKAPGPIYYLDQPKPGQPHIWSFTHVEMTDKQNRPTPSAAELPQMPTVTADGMRIFLSVDTPATAGAPKKADRKAASGVSGVERIELDRNVVMNLWSESRNMFGGDAGKDKDPKAKKIQPKDPNAPPPEKVLIKIRTNGPFNYDLVKDKAHFEMPPPRDPNIVEYVTVTRKAKGNSEDTLTCDFLDVQFKRRKPGESGKDGKSLPAPVAVDADKPNNPQNDMEIETIHAWGKNIAMSSDQESLFAYGYDLFYDANIKQTVLKGSPMHAVKDGNLIRAPELILANLDDKEKQHAKARGPGQVGMGEMDPKTQEHARQAHWNEWLIVTKVNEHGRDLDLIILTGGASFSDSANEQMLTGKQLKLWLLNRDEPAGAKKQPAKVTKVEVVKADPQTQEKKQPLPFRLEASGDVTARAPEMIVHKTEYLNVWFKDLEPMGPEPLPDPREPGAARGPDLAAPAKVDTVQPMPKKNDPFPPKKILAPGQKRDPPIEIRYARRIETWVNRVNGKNELDKAHTEGNVVVHQDPTAENEKGIDIAGHAVDAEHYLDGNHLIVTGTDQTLGEVHLPEKLSIIGDDIRIDQRNNIANVKGWGRMRLMSKTDLEGKELEKPTWIDVDWKDEMKLEGAIRSVGFSGKVQASQNNAKVLCESMQVWLDRPLYLNPKKSPEATVIKDLSPMVISKDPKNPKAKEDKNPKVVKVLCDQQPAEGGIAPKDLRPVFIEDVEMLNGKLVRYQNVQGLQVDMDNPANKMMTIGPGTVRMFQLGAQDPLVEKPMGQEKAKASEEMKLTWVTFDERMLAYNKMPKRAKFFGNIEVVHMPSDKHDVKINVAKLPERAMHLKCEKSLEVITQTRMVKDAKGKEVEYKWQEMVAEGNVRIRGDEYDGWAGTVTYSEDKSLVVLTGTAKNPAILRKSEVKGAERKEFRGAKITYNTKTKDFSIDDSIGGSSN